MISVSDLAKGVLLQSLQESGVPPDEGLRLKAGQDGLVLETGTPTEQDRVIDHQGSTVIIVDQELEEMIGDAVIDIAEGEESSQLVFRRMSNDGRQGGV